MRKSTILLLILVSSIAVLILAPVALADTPGETAGRDLSAPMLNLAALESLPEGASAPACMLQNGWVWSVDVTRAGPGQFTFAGTLERQTGYLWDASGTATRMGPGQYDTYFLAENPQADGCSSSWEDYIEFFGTGGQIQSGDYTYYCGGDPFGTGTWFGTVYPASHPVCPNLSE